ncbi:unnamed protein product [Oppiella nova]|uniref:Uncharacterized protein n=1 Tax=Oppiella nova TaxID=334625 RepID=A0A7R9LVP1_9ACAR|nr:unnamed protein product [Oppiella nova]CAG2167406.1 unnamed protein product [Oppiella nova]
MNRGSNEINKCYTKYIDGVLGAKNAVDKRKIPHNCCEYFRIFSCSETRMRTVKGCTEQQIDITLDWIRSLFGNVIDLICSDYTEGSDKCSSLEPVPKKRKNQRRPKSFMLPLVDLLASFKEL